MIPLQCQTLSKQSTQWPEGLVPKYLHDGTGCRVWDVDGNQWIDWTMGLGPMILGYGNQAVNQAMHDQILQGPTFGLPHPLEVEVAEKIVEMCPGVEAVRLGKTGSDAVAAAVRLARVHTGRNRILVDDGYHGWHDWFAILTDRKDGILQEQDLWTWRWNGKLGNGKLGYWMMDAAAFVLEPDRFEPDVLQHIVDFCKYSGTVVIFDEVITGFRMAPGGARQALGVIPDISCYGKAMANGMAVSAVAGPWEIMQNFEYGFWSTTHGGETISLAAAKATLEQLADGKLLADMAIKGEWLRDKLEEYGVPVTGYPQHLVWNFDDLEHKTWVQQCFAEDGILFNGHFFMSAAHTEEDIHWTIVAAKHAQEHPRVLKCPVVKPVYRQP